MPIYMRGWASGARNPFIPKGFGQVAESPQKTSRLQSSVLRRETLREEHNALRLPLVKYFCFLLLSLPEACKICADICSPSQFLRTNEHVLHRLDNNVQQHDIRFHPPRYKPFCLLKKPFC